tara:strand:- start:1381 stop:3135 length:1755 start_codon:yes stop_codon:yes gene_type:complete
MFSLKKAWLVFDTKQKKYLTIIFIFMLISMMLEALSIGIILPLISILLKGNIDSNVFSNLFGFVNFEGKNLILFGLFATLLIFVIKNSFLIFNHWHQSNFLEKINISLADKLYRNYLRRDYIFFLQTNSASLLRNLRSEVGSFKEYINRAITFYSEIIIFLGIVSVLFYVDFLGTTIILILVTFFSSIIYFFTRKKIDFFGKERILIEGELNKHLLQGLSSAKDVKILDREEDLIYQFYKNLLSRGKLNLYILFTQGLPKFLFEVIIVLAFLILVISMMGAQKNMIDIVQYLGVFAAASFRIIPGAARIFTSLQVMKFKQPAVNLISDELNQKENYYQKEKNKKEFSKKQIKFDNEININNLSFTYPIRKEFSLSEISMSIKKGDFVGIIGETGSGKSTLINLFTGLLKPSGGEINVDNLNIFSNLNGWHKKIGYVPQSIYLIDDTIRKNIAFGLREEDIDDNLVLQAVEKANLSELLSKLPNGLETIVGEKGIRLSGGQQQRIGIARSLYRDPEILILDEATSSLDQATEKKIMNSVHVLKRKKTLIIVTHRLSTVNECDKIFFINKGKIINQGTPKEVLKNL